MEAITHYFPNISISTFKFKLLYFSFIVALLFAHCDARKLTILSQKTSRPITTNQNMKHLKILEMAKSLNMLVDVSVKDTSIGSPFTLPPYDSLPPVPLAGPNTNPPYCVYPPPNPQSPSTTIPTPIGPTPTIPIVSPSPPIIFPGPPNYVPNPPPYYYEPSPPSGSIIPSPPTYVPSPIGFEPSPPVFEPPVVYPPPTGSPPTFGGGGHGHGRVWCVAKPTVPDPIIQEAMNYACGSGADCNPIQPNGSCFQPDTLLAHASYAFNSYWQRTKVAGGTCSFGGTAILVTLDPSSEGCHFESY